jgi:uncharacterized membrane protein YphA (DoxX/SURF4 family)
MKMENKNAFTLATAFLVVARWALAAVFIYLGFEKALQPVEFLKLLRQFHVFETPWLLNFAAATLPWFEIICGLLLLLGVAVRGTALIVLGLLVPFTVMVLLRALELRGASGVALCAVKFDCGCGTGEVLACGKLAENALLIVLAIALVVSTCDRFCLRPVLRGDPRA